MNLLIDNYDSFAYNLYQYLGEIDPQIAVVRNDEVDSAAVREMGAERIVISPGPGYPADAGNCIEIIRALSGEVPILGVCLGHQAICEAFGATIVHARELMHGKQSRATFHADCPLFDGLPPEGEVARYHSLAVDPDTLPGCLKPVSRAYDGEVMGVQHAEHPTFGLQFHPESVMTPQGKQMIENFMGIAIPGPQECG